MIVRSLVIAVTAILSSATFASSQSACSTHWDVVLSVASSSGPIGALYTSTDYSGAVGEFFGSGALVDCTNLVPGTLFATNDNEMTRDLAIGFVTPSGFSTPRDLARCTFIASGATTSSDFTPTVVDATDASGEPVSVTLAISVHCSLCGDGIVQPNEACDPAIEGQECCHPGSCSGIIAGCSLCGNGIVNAGEQCDDSNLLSGDCCSSTCQAETAGAACGNAATGSCTAADTCDGAGTCDSNDVEDGTACGGDACKGAGSCSAGVCSGGTPADCDDGNPCTQDSCDAGTGECISSNAPATGCRSAGNSGLQFGTAGSGKAKWRWQKGATTECADFGSPDSTTAFDVCVYDGVGGGDYVLATSLHIPAGSSWAQNKDCSESGSRWAYRDPAGAADGVVKMLLRPGTEGKSSIALAAKGNMSPPVPTPVSSSQFLNLNPDVTVQMFDGSGACWESVFTDSYKNSGVKFKTAKKVIVTP
jgi:cysteine-rich repeat protein